MHHEIYLGHVCRQRRNALAGSLGALTGAAECRNSGVQSATAWRRATCGSSDHGLPALRDEPILGFRAGEFHRTVAPELPFPYQGPLSLTPEGEHALSRVFTLFTGVELTSHAEVLFQLESAGGKGIGNGFGLAGFTNLDVVHNPSLGSKPYVGRTMLHFAIPLSHDRTPTERNPLSVFRNLPARRLEIRLGKFQLVDFST